MRLLRLTVRTDDVQQTTLASKIARLKPVVAGIKLEEMASSHEVLSRIDQHVADLNNRLPEAARIQRYKVLAREFSVREAEATPSMLLCRTVVAKKYGDLIADCYSK
jgi:long-subunit acyl-CoA synthetase (AMP-forming)